MLKLTGVFLVIGGFAGYGMLERAGLKGRVRQMKQALEVMRSINSEILYGKASLETACRETAARVSAPYQLFLRRVYEESRKNSGQSFYEIWEKEFSGIDRALLLNYEEKELFKEFGCGSNSTDMALQKAGMERIYEEMKRRTRQAEIDCENRVKIALCLSTAGGMVLAMLLI